MKMNECILYRLREEDQILKDMDFLIENYENSYYNKEDMKGLFYTCVGKLLDLAVSHGFTGNLWQDYLTYYLVSHENGYSTSCEIVGEVEGSINEAALHDFCILKSLYDYDFTEMETALGVEGLSMIRAYTAPDGHGKVFNRRIRDRIDELAVSLSKADTAEVYRSYRLPRLPTYTLTIWWDMRRRRRS